MGAELLQCMEFKAEARSILFRLATQSMSDVQEVLWIADACLLCDLPHTAGRILLSIRPELLDNEEQQRFVQIQSGVRIACLGSESKSL